MGSNLAPGVEIIERSFSTRLEANFETVFATVGLYSKGPVNEAVRISSEQELVEKFGRPDDFSYKYFFPAVKILEQAPIEVLRVENSSVLCSGLTVSDSGVTASLTAPVSAYPLSYDSLIDASVSVDASGFNFLSVGPGQYYNNYEVAAINKGDYDYLRLLQLELAEAVTRRQRRQVLERVFTSPGSWQGLSLTNSIRDELISGTPSGDVDAPSGSLDIDEVALDAYLFFERGPKEDDEFAIYEFEKGAIVNAYLVSNDPEKKDVYAKSMFANKVVEANSENIRVFISNARATADAVTPVSFPRTALSGATDLTTDESLVEDEIYLKLSEVYGQKEEISFTAFVDFDFSDAIKQRMDELSQIRQDVIALLNVPANKMINLNSQQKVANATTAIKNYVDNDLNINSSYSGIYANYFKVYDAYNDEERWVPCTGHVANRMAFTFANFEPWYAFAGLERGIISGVLKVAYNPTDAQRKVLYPARINTIVDFRGEGIVIWGQKTLLATPSSLDRLNVRNLFIYIEKALEKFSRYTLFKQNDEFTRTEWKARVEPFLASIQSRRGVLEYLVVCDESNNTPEVVARNEFQAYVIVRPTPVVEFIKIVVADVGGNLSLQEAVQGVQI